MHSMLLRFGLAAGLALPVGCTQVDPRPDYERAAARITQATGQDAVYRPGDDEAIAGQVEAMVADGLSVAEAVQVCLLNNPGLQAAFHEIGVARADLVQAGLLSNPSLGASVRLPAGGGLANVEAGLAQNIADLWQIPPRKQAAKHSLDRVVLDVARQAVERASEAKTAYFRALGAREVHAIARENLAITRQLLDLAIARKDAGEGSELDVNLSRTAVQESRLAVETSRLAEAEAHRHLAKLLGLTDDPARIVLTERFEPAGPPALDAESLVELASRSRLDILAAREASAQAEGALREQYARVLRTVEIGVALERGESKKQGGRDILADTVRASVANGGLTAPEIEPPSQRRSNTDFIIGPSIDLELPIFDQNQAQIAKARFALQQARKALDALERSAIQDVRNAADRVTTAWSVVRFYREELLPLAERSLSMNREAYRAGSTSILAVLEAQRFLLDARRRQVEAVRDASGLAPELELAVGVPMAAMGDAASSRPAGAASRPATNNLRKESE